jgi:hypothetical protein
VLGRVVWERREGGGQELYYEQLGEITSRWRSSDTAFQRPSADLCLSVLPSLLSCSHFPSFSDARLSLLSSLRHAPHPPAPRQSYSNFAPILLSYGSTPTFPRFSFPLYNRQLSTLNRRGFKCTLTRAISRHFMPIIFARVLRRMEAR